MSVHLVVGGDIGDCIASLPILRQLGGGKLTLVPTPHPGAKDWQAGARLLMPLIEAQPYVDSVAWSDREPACDFNTSRFRSQGCYSPFQTLAESQAKSIGLEGLDLSPWLTAQASAHSTHRVIFSRSLRYRNPKFPWRMALQRYGANSLFLGLQNEYTDMQRYAVKMEFYRMQNFLDAAEVIQGCRMLVANQSCFGWIAMGLGKPLVQEGHETSKDSRCPRPGNIYWTEGPLILP